MSNRGNTHRGERALRNGSPFLTYSYKWDVVFLTLQESCALKNCIR